MLVSFSLENWKSFKESSKLSLVAGEPHVKAGPSLILNNMVPNYSRLLHCMVGMLQESQTLPTHCILLKIW